MILAYKPSLNGQECYWFGKDNGLDFKFIRVVCGAVFPIYDRQFAAAVVIGEIYRVTAPPSWIVLNASCREWAEVSNDLAQFRRDQKFDHIIVDREEARSLVWKIESLKWGIERIPMVSYTAPKYAMTEVGRAVVDQLGKENRLTLGGYRGELERGEDIAGAALRAAMCFLKDNPAMYAPLKRQSAGMGGRILGMEGL